MGGVARIRHFPHNQHILILVLDLGLNTTVRYKWKQWQPHIVHQSSGASENSRPEPHQKYTLTLDSNFALFLIDRFTWEKRTKANPLHGFRDTECVDISPGLTDQQKVNLLDLVLEQIANYCTVISQNSGHLLQHGRPSASITVSKPPVPTGGHRVEGAEEELLVSQRAEEELIVSQ